MPGKKSIRVESRAGIVRESTILPRAFSMKAGTGTDPARGSTVSENFAGWTVAATIMKPDPTPLIVFYISI
jgi:hypothetical protein